MLNHDSSRKRERFREGSNSRGRQFGQRLSQSTPIASVLPGREAVPPTARWAVFPSVTYGDYGLGWILCPVWTIGLVSRAGLEPATL